MGEHLAEGMVEAEAGHPKEEVTILGLDQEKEDIIAEVILLKEEITSDPGQILEMEGHRGLCHIPVVHLDLLPIHQSIRGDALLPVE